MPADYQKIREENIARYGWDTAVLDLLGQLYSERTHFIFELIQNAEDAGRDRAGLRAVRGPAGAAARRPAVHRSRRPRHLRGRPEPQIRRPHPIGQFGIGFKSVYAYTRSPHVHSGDEHFRIENYVRPHAADPPAGGGGTLFVFPFDHDDVPAVVAVREISAALTALEPGILLFLASITRLRVGGAGVAPAVIARRAQVLGGGCQRVIVSKGRPRAQEWLVWHRPLEGLGAEVLPGAGRSRSGWRSRSGPRRGGSSRWTARR